MKEIRELKGWINGEVYDILEKGRYDFPIFIFQTNDDILWVLYRRLGYYLWLNE